MIKKNLLGPGFHPITPVQPDIPFMNEKEISLFLDPRFKLLRSLRDGAGDREIMEGKKAIGEILVRFPYPPVAFYGRRSLAGFDKALRYVDQGKKNEAANEASEYFLDRAHQTICECEKNRHA